MSEEQHSAGDEAVAVLPQCSATGAVK
jgi:hypothetical protein